MTHFPMDQATRNFKHREGVARRLDRIEAGVSAIADALTKTDADRLRSLRLLQAVGERDALEHQLERLRRELAGVLRGPPSSRDPMRATELQAEIAELEPKWRESNERVRQLKAQRYEASRTASE